MRLIVASGRDPQESFGKGAGIAVVSALANALKWEEGISSNSTKFQVGFYDSSNRIFIAVAPTLPNAPAAELAAPINGLG